MVQAAYGSWASRVTSQVLTSASVDLSAPAVDRGDIYWLESRADQGGRSSLWRLAGDASMVELTPAPFNVRSQVHEYGGGEFSVRDGVVAFSSFPDGRVYVRREGGAPRPVTPDRVAVRYGDLRVHPDRNLLLCVREDHRGTGEPVNTLVALDLDGPNNDCGRVLCSGAAFYSTPELAADGGLAWVEWDHPDMPWDSTRLQVGRLSGSETSQLRLAQVTQVAGGPAESALQPRWTPSGTLVFVSDRNGWWNLYGATDGAVRPLYAKDAEFCGPQWRLGEQPYAVVDDNGLLCSWVDGGASHLGLLDHSTGELVPIGAGGGATAVAASAETAAAVLSQHDRPVGLSRLELGSLSWTEIRHCIDTPLESAEVSRAQAVSWTSTTGPVFGWFYPPTNPGYTAPSGTLPPMVTVPHGGPTAWFSGRFSLATQFWTSRGVAVLEVNYGGSTGYGRRYRDRLRGSWGVVDVEDCVAGAVAMAERGLADRRRLAVAGGSAGGYTALRAITATNVFSAGISLYGVADLEALVRDTHKFESRYLDGLVGPYPQAADRYRDRSPIHHLDTLQAPILLLQGAEDKVVLPNQARSMADAARRKGLAVALLVFPGEAHGFRRSESIRAAVEAQLFFLGRVFDFVPADDLPAIQIDNLPG